MNSYMLCCKQEDEVYNNNILYVLYFYNNILLLLILFLVILLCSMFVVLMCFRPGFVLTKVLCMDRCCTQLLKEKLNQNHTFSNRTI